MIDATDLETWWTRYGAQLLSFTRAKVSTLEDAEDLIQEVFLRLYTRLCCMRDEDGMVKIAFRVTRNLIIDRYRSTRLSVPLDESLPANVDGPEPDWDAATALAPALRETVEQLPEPYRSALILTGFDGLSQVALAERERLPVSTVKSRVQRAREKVKAALLACCHFELDARGGVISYHRRSCPCGV